VQSLPTIVSLIKEGQLKNMLYDAIIVDLQAPTPEAEKILLTLEEVLREQSCGLIILHGANTKDRELSLHTSYSLVEKNQSFTNLRAALNREINGVVPAMQDIAQDFSFAGLNILVAEDNSVNQMVIQSMLHKLGANTFIVEDGEKALQSYKAAAEMYDIILMDCELPGRNGFDTTLAIRQFESSHKLARKPIIALTAHNDVQILRKTLKCGMDDHLTKPLNIASLTETLLAYVKKI
jgi:CheY-like chemotaxis protein